LIWGISVNTHPDLNTTEVKMSRDKKKPKKLKKPITPPDHPTNLLQNRTPKK
jgi:hypothetical protein